MANYNLSECFQGLGTFVLGQAPSTDNYTIQGKISLPKISQGDAHNSAVVVVVKKASTTIYTGAAGADGFSVNAAITAGQSISIVLSSALAEDNATNAIKTKVVVFEGVN